MDFIKEHLNKFVYKSPKFYVGLVGNLLVMIAGICYATLVSASDLVGDKYNPAIIALCIVCFVLFLAANVFDFTAKYSNIVCWTFGLIIFFVFINTVYMYFSSVFYNGITWDAIIKMDKGVLFGVIFFVIGCIAGNVSLYLPNGQKKNIEEPAKEEVKEAK